MPISLRELTTSKRTISVFNGEVNITYSPDKISASMLFNSVPPKEQTDLTIKDWLSQIINSLVDVIESWDLFDVPEEKGGKLLPITKETLMDILGFTRTMEIYTTLMADFQVPNTKGSHSTTA